MLFLAPYLPGQQRGVPAYSFDFAKVRSLGTGPVPSLRLAPYEARSMTDHLEWQGRVGDVWAEEWRRTDRALATMTVALNATILAAAPEGPFRALDIGCGAGETSLALAAARPDASIAGVDLSSALTDTARERAGGNPQLTFAVGDAVAHARATGPFDLLYSRHGVMFFPEPPAAFAAFHGSARPGAALVFSCFADPEDNVLAAPLARALGLAPPVAGDAPGPYAFAREDDVVALLTTAGWRDVRGERVTFGYRVGAGPAALDDAVCFLSRIGPAAAAIRRGSDAEGLALTASLRAFLSNYLADNTVDLPASVWLFSARA